MTPYYLLIGGPSTGAVVSELPDGYESTGRPSSGTHGASLIIAGWTYHGFDAMSQELVEASEHLWALLEARGIREDEALPVVDRDDVELLAAIERSRLANRRQSEWLTKYV
ncbi:MULTISPECIES: hypothetical protein [unclassified Microbacterium]|uniref:hypothetical protein n=1 Tax=unclassified Microbacterium TaxID=2609290 RepID=UPI003018D5C5